jgi:hypothetical protein
MYFASHAAPFNALVLTDVSTVSIVFLAAIIKIDKGFQCLRFMDCCVGLGIVADEL